VQGALGGMRVLLDERTLAMLHGCVGPAFFSLAVVLVAVTGRRWQTADAVSDSRAGKLQRLALFTAALAYVQLVLGAQLRHTPVDVGIAFFRTALYFHLLVAAALVAHVVMIAVNAFRLPAGCGIVRRSAGALLFLVGAQICLGASTWVVKYGWPQWLGEHVFTESYTVQREAFWSSLTITAHVATGSLILATAVLLSVQAFRYLDRSSTAASTSTRGATASEPGSATAATRNPLMQRFVEAIA
jgi:cytochrome c oxidase assembly protein subunit 15